MPHPTRRAFARGAVATTICCLVVAYPLSYAPYLRFQYGPYESRGMSSAIEELVPDKSADFGETLYAPVDWLIDHTRFEKPLLFWADLWGARHHHRNPIFK